jgi:hypothetical protein
MEIQDAIAELLDSLGFRAMANDALRETDPAMMARYGKVILRWAPESHRRQIQVRLFKLGVI